MALFKRGKYYYTRFQIKGQKIYESTKCKRLAEAKEYEKNLKDSIRKSDKVFTGYTFDDACKRWIETEAPKSMYAHIKLTLDYMEHSLLTDCIKNAGLMKTDLMKKGLNPQTINRRLAVVRRVLNKAFDEYEMIELPLGAKIKNLMLSEKGYAREIFLTQKEATHLLSFIKESKVKNFFIGLLATGLRKSELLNLEADQYVNGTIKLTSKTKGKRPRSVPVPEWAQHAFKDLPMPVGHDQIRYQFDKARIKAGMPEVRIHDLRHTFASWLAMNPEIPMIVIRDLLGHSSISTTNKYAHLREDALKSATDTIPKIG